jgi:predicted ATPase
LLTLIGVAGCGKTRLSLQVASRQLAKYSDGVWLVELAALNDPSLVAQKVAATFGLREQPGRPLVDTLLDYLQPRRLLLVLDNCEHLHSSCAALADTLLAACPMLNILATSRQPLGAQTEAVWSVPVLPMPCLDHTQTVEDVREYEAVQLFVERARSKRLDFDLTPDNAQAVAQVCYHLDGLPLAIELAAARVVVLSVEQIAAMLNGRFRLLTRGDPTALPRHQSLQAAMDWSYNLLSDPEKSVLSGLSVFASGATLDAMIWMCGGKIDRYQTVDLLHDLADK